jgi:hypothetical protein
MLDRFHFIDIRQTNSAGAFNPIITGSGEWFPYLYATSVITYAGLPTNFWDYTPFFTCAFDTNYGYPAMRSVLNQLVLTDGNLSSPSKQARITEIMTNTFDITTNDYAYARTSAISHWTNASNWMVTNIVVTNQTVRPPFRRNVTYSGTERVVIQWFADPFDVRNQVNGHDEIIVSTTSAWSEAWAFVASAIGGSGATTHTNYWTNGVTSGTSYFYEKVAATNAATRSYTDFPISGTWLTHKVDVENGMPTNHPGALAIRQYAGGNSANLVQGTKITQWLFFWNVTNGFKYVP